MELGRVYTTVSIVSTGAAATKVLAAGVAGQINRLHALHCTASTTGELQVLSAAVALTGKWRVPGAFPRVDIPFVPQIEGCLSSSVGAALNLNSTAAELNGYAVVSQSTA